MKKRQKDLKTDSFILFFAIVCLLFFGFFLKPIFADDTTTNCDTLTGDAKDQCVNLEKKAKVYQDLIALKNKQQDTLSSQIDYLNQQQVKNQTDLQDIQKQIKDLDQQIQDLERSIADKQDQVDSQKKVLEVLMQNYYEYDQQGVLNLVLMDKDFSDTFSQTDYTQQSSTRVSEILDNIQKAKNDLTAQRDDLNQKREDSNKLKESLSDKQDDLQTSENQKQNLLTQTQGEEQKYQALLDRVEEQKKQLFDFSSASNIGELSASVSSYPAPKSHLASTSWYFSQTDDRWGDKRIGNSKSLMKDYGCAVTSVAMVFREKGSSIDPGKMATQKIFSFDLINWPTTWNPGIALTSSVSHGNINWKTIDKEISNGNPVIIYIEKTNGGGGHYVVITGKDNKDYIVHDPYFGPNLYLSTSKSLVGKIGTDSGVRLDQMIIYH